MSDSITSSHQVRCPCGRPYLLIEGVQGRVEEALEFPVRAGGQIRVQPAVFHSVMDAVPAKGWQLVRNRTGWPCCSPAPRTPSTTMASRVGSGTNCSHAEW